MVFLGRNRIPDLDGFKKLEPDIWPDFRMLPELDIRPEFWPDLKPLSTICTVDNKKIF